MGLTVREVQPGTPAPDDQLTTLSIPAAVTLGGAPMDVLFAGLAPGQIGVYQVNVRVGENVPVSDAASLEIKQGAGATALTVRVVQ
jgi:uncharacterized protein (TIGR03437 family)